MAEGPAIIALGSNLADPFAQLRRARLELSALGRELGASSLYRTAPVGGPAGQPPYLNAALALEPGPGLQDPVQLLEALHGIERLHGRERRVRWEARPLDLDLLDWGGVVRDGPDLTLPHPLMMERAFVLAPLCELAPAWRHPISGRGACEALRELDGSAVRRSRRAWGPR